MSEAHGDARWLARTLDRVERTGNALPHPVSLFVILSVAVVLLSAAIHFVGVEAVHPVSGASMQAENLLSVAALQRLALGVVRNFMEFPPLGPVLVCLLGLAVAEHSGLLGAAVRLLAGRTTRRGLTLLVVACGVLSHSAGDVGYVLLVPLGGALFHAVGRNPLAGIAAAFSGVSGGFAANVLLSPTDLVLAGMTEQAAQAIAAGYTVSPMANYFFLATSVVIVTAVGTVVTERVIVPQLGDYRGDVVAEKIEPLQPRERRALGWALAAVLALGLVVLAGLGPADGFLRDPARPGVIGSYFVRGLTFFIFLFGFVPGLVYGVAVGTIRCDRDVYRGMQKHMEVIGGYLVLMFFVAQFVYLFGASNLGLLLAIKGAELLRALGLGPVPLAVSVVLLTATLNLCMGSASAKWAILAPVLVPMFMLLGYSPEFAQATYRVGDSLTNIVTPISSNFPLVLMFVQRYLPRAGIGTLMATMLPYAAANLVCWTGWLVFWLLMGWPVGPAAPLWFAR